MSGHPPGRRPLVIAAPLRIEALALRGAVPGARLVRTGMGPRRASSAAARLAPPAGGWALAVAGLCGGLDPELRPGDVVVASEVRGPDGTVGCTATGPLVAAVQRRGLQAHLGPVLCVDHVVDGPERARLHATGAIAADMESCFLAVAAGGGPFAVLRVVLDAPGRELKRPGLAAAAARALRVLRRVAPALEDWSVANAATMQSASRNAVIPKEVT
jgi:4-hydroxy-3-methylbut-2-en-1-yl diphosphate reductase